MSFINEENQKFLREKFAKEMAKDVTITVFGQGDSLLSVPTQDCMYCKETKQLMEEISGLSDKIHLQELDFVKDSDRAKQMGVDKIPAIVLDGEGTPGVKYYGIPSGYEFSSVIEDIVDVSKHQTDLSANTKQALQKLSKDVHIQVFVTPT
ncbi:MAG: thioredoxin family protein [Chloroflexi bacterium]|nr:thioredoxin family protein [Chloroflexota bacterium]